jgi:hypothetical protein
LALEFTNDQIANMSKGILTLPGEITLSKGNSANQDTNKVDLKKKDDNNKTFYDNYVNIVNQYHSEYKNINGTVKPDYVQTELDKGARLTQDSLHFLTSPMWTGFKPKLIPSNNGNPVTSDPISEKSQYASWSDDVGVFLNGFTGIASTSTLSQYSATSGVNVVDTSNFTPGQKVFLYSGSDGMYGTVSGISGQTITFNVIIAPSGNLNPGSGLTNNFTGFTNSERESGSATKQHLFTSFKTRMMGFISQYKVNLQAEQSALNANDASSPDKDEIAVAKTNVASQISTVTAWQAAPDTGVGTARWGNTVINPFKAAMISRDSFSTTRIAQINLRLGSVTQDGKGEVTGAGSYFKQFDWINMRINKVTGTLTQYYMSDLGGAALNEDTSGKEKQLAEYKSVIAATKITKDGDRTSVVDVENVSEFVIGNEVYIIDDDTPFTKRTILSISGNSVTLNDIVSTEYKVDSLARLVRRK